MNINISRLLTQYNTMNNFPISVCVCYPIRDLRSFEIRIGHPDSIQLESNGQIQIFGIAVPATFAIVP